MAVQKRGADYFETEAGREFTNALKEMAHDKAFNTDPSFSANSVAYPDKLIPFVNKHIEYLRTHPSVDPQHYLSNLRLMTRRR